MPRHGQVPHGRHLDDVDDAALRPIGRACLLEIDLHAHFPIVDLSRLSTNGRIGANARQGAGGSRVISQGLRQARSTKTIARVGEDLLHCTGEDVSALLTFRGYGPEGFVTPEDPMSHTFPSPMSTHVRVDGLSFSYRDRRVLTDVSFVAAAGDRVGLIGENGCGKSTLLRLISGALEPDAGTITVNAVHPPSVGLLHQEPPFPEHASVSDAIESAVAPARHAAEAVGTLASALASRPHDHEAADAFARSLDTAERLDAWGVDATISTMLTGLGLGAVDRNRQVGTLSGGQRARLALAWLLLSAPDVLLLDEPTNHLDDSAADYLARVLTAWRGPVLIASHDRAFLDTTASSLLDLDPSPLPHALTGELVHDGTGTGIGVTRFTGTYSHYLATRAKEHARWERQYRDEREELSRLRAAVREQQTVGHSDRGPRTEARSARKFYSDRNATVVSRRVNDARSRLSDLEQRQIRKPPADLEFRGLTAGGNPRDNRPPGPVLTAVNAAVTGRLPATSVGISRGEKWLITGANGSGKSTLLRLLAGTLEPSHGQVTHSPEDRVRLLSQDIFIPDPSDRGSSRTARETYSDLVGVDLAEKVPLSTFGLLAGRDQNRSVLDLSVGQQRRLALAILLADPPEILLLDEPTNHFSLSLVTALESALTHYPGTVIVASHDRWLRGRWSGQRLHLEGTNIGSV
ncbi:ABC-F family ATP-binding cassette domain-containing protein [Flaviflexus equikiangi]